MDGHLLPVSLVDGQTQEKKWEKEGKGKEGKRIGKKQEHSFLLPLGFIPYTAQVKDGEIGEGRNQGKCLVLFSLIGCPGNAPVL